ncbi:MAG TPA: rhodanese-like domain-containing protein, partial [Bacillota bacterium]|nr:rhodanese-like domain-containing protein [Bacillota bacterium]
MKKLLKLALLIPLIFVVSCSAAVKNITAEEGKAMMDADSSIVLVDVRTAEEFAGEHIPGAILLPVDDIQVNAENVLR